MINNIILVGLKSSGKTLVGNQLAKITPLVLYDMDREVYKKYGANPEWIVDIEGEDSFIKRCLPILQEILEKKCYTVAMNTIASMNSSISRILLASGIVVYLRNTPDQYAKQLSISIENAKAMIHDMDLIYLNSADLVVNVDLKNASIIAANIIASIKL